MRQWPQSDDSWDMGVPHVGQAVFIKGKSFLQLEQMPRRDIFSRQSKQREAEKRLKIFLISIRDNKVPHFMSFLLLRMRR